MSATRKRNRKHDAYLTPLSAPEKLRLYARIMERTGHPHMALELRRMAFDLETGGPSTTREAAA